MFRSVNFRRLLLALVAVGSISCKDNGPGGTGPARYSFFSFFGRNNSEFVTVGAYQMAIDEGTLVLREDGVAISNLTYRFHLTTSPSAITTGNDVFTGRWTITGGQLAIFFRDAAGAEYQAVTTPPDELFLHLTQTWKNGDASLGGNIVYKRQFDDG